MSERTQNQIDDAREAGQAIMRRIHATEQAPAKVAARAGIFHASEKFRGDEDFTVTDVLRILEALDASYGRPQSSGRNAPVVEDGAAPRLLKVAEVAERLGVGTDWVYGRINRGEIPVVELGDNGQKNQRIRESDLAQFIDRRTYGNRVSR